MFTHQDTAGSGGLFPLGNSQEEPSGGTVVLAEEGDTNSFESEEILIIDHRAHVGPAQQVENKLGAMLGGGALPISHVRMLAQLGNRSHC